MSVNALLEKIREIEGFDRAILTKIEIEKRPPTATFFLTTDVVYTGEGKERAKAVCKEFLPGGFEADVRITKSVPDETAVKRRILQLVSKASPAASAFVREEDVAVEMQGRSVRFSLGISKEEKKFLPADAILDEVVKGLAASFCGYFQGTVEEVEKTVEVEEEETIEEEEEEVFAPRFFPIEGYYSIDGGEKPSKAMYIEDCNKEYTEVTLCGVVSFLRERQTSKGKPYFRLVLSDGTGNIHATYFTKQATVEKIRALKEGDKIVVFGNNELFNGDYCFRIKTINGGTMSENYAIERRPMRQAPLKYHTVFPEKYEDFEQTDLFGKRELPADLLENEFVVFDLETTGLNNTGTGGDMDKIIEIGAVRIKNGEIVEKFSSFVAYDKKLPDNIVELTGITDDMLVGAPKIQNVIADFYKFADGCKLVGHNVTFDYRFVEYYGNKERYSFTQTRYDTMTIGQSVLVLPNYKLNTLADHFGVTFNHHRAFDDALATAKIFIELVRLKKGLPKT